MPVHRRRGDACRIQHKHACPIDCPLDRVRRHGRPHERREGHVTLSGAVTYNEQIAIAVDAARKVEGVIEVENRIRVTGASL
nr:BON domain-containing protein [Burkholderia multivorans]